MRNHIVRTAALGAVTALAVSGCGFTPYDIPLPGGADLGSDPYSVKVEFRDVLDLVPQSAVRVNEIAVGKVTDIQLNGWTAIVTVKINGDTKLPDNAMATIRQTSLLGEKFVSLAPPTEGAAGSLSEGDKIPLDRSGRNPEVEEVLGATSLLFNGGGLEKTNTIMRELNKALDGNEGEVKSFISTSTDFLAQLDDNKAALLTSLEKIDRLAVTTNKQKSSITNALDELPSAFRVLDQQRGDLVKLLQSLDRLGDVATDVVRRSKADTVADFQALQPVLTQLAKAGDDLAYDFKALLTYPFTDGVVGGTVAKASGRCANTDREKNTGACFGDYSNLSGKMDIGAGQLENLFGGFDLTGLLSDGEPGSAPVIPLTDLVQLVEGLVPASPALPGGVVLPGTSGSSGGGTTGEPAPSSSTPKSGGICGLLGTCRVAAANQPTNDVGRILMEPVVAR
ncbi:MCE family protein [Aeromicrobium sp.]|uniref:MCE family protein n=1 Tax=Aeromicrobium sp. TaxID=1871063 RepID=UPI003C5B43B8